MKFAYSGVVASRLRKSLYGRYALCLRALLLLSGLNVLGASSLQAQQPCTSAWTLNRNAFMANQNRPQNVLSAPSGVYKIQYNKEKCGCRTNYVAVGAKGIKNGYPAKKVTITLKGFDCNGKELIASYWGNNVAPGQWDAGSANWTTLDGSNATTVLFVEVEYYDEELKATYRYVSDYRNGLHETYINDKPYSKMVQEEADIRKEIKTQDIPAYNQIYKELNAALQQLQDARLQGALQQKLSANYNSFTHYAQQAEGKLVAGDIVKDIQNIQANIQGLTRALAAMKEEVNNSAAAERKKQAQQQEKLRERQPQPQRQPPSQAPNQRPQSPQRQPQQQHAPTYQQPSAADAARQQNQISASEFILKAQNSADAIDRAYNLNMAKISATAAGDQALLQQIEQLQTQAQQQQLQDLGSQLQQSITGQPVATPQQNLDQLRNQNSQLEDEQAGQKDDLKNSMKDFFKKAGKP